MNQLLHFVGIKPNQEQTLDNTCAWIAHIPLFEKHEPFLVIFFTCFSEQKWPTMARSF